MKIIIPLLGFGKSGGFRVLSQFANYWIDLEHDVTFLCSSNSIMPYFPTKAQIIWFNDNGDIVESPMITKTSPLNVFRKQYALYKALNRFARGSYIVIANHSLTALPVAKSKICAKKFYYVQAYEPDYYAHRKGLIGKFLEIYTKYSYKLKNLTKIVNSPIYYEFKNLNSNKFVPCGLDLSVYYPKTDYVHNNIVKIGAIGRIEVFKGTKYVLDAFNILIKNNSQKQFMLYLAFGDKSLESEFIKCPHPNGDHELAQFYRDMDIVIAPGTTQYGAIHYPVIEAMACGTPIVTTYYMPATNANAWLVNPHDVDSIVFAVISILENFDDSIKKVRIALEDIKQFKWEVVSQQMIKYFEIT